MSGKKYVYLFAAGKAEGQGAWRNSARRERGGFGGDDQPRHPSASRVYDYD